MLYIAGYVRRIALDLELHKCQIHANFTHIQQTRTYRLYLQTKRAFCDRQCMRFQWKFIYW